MTTLDFVIQLIRETGVKGWSCGETWESIKFPELVTEDGSSENYLLVNSSMMILPIIQGIQQLTNELQAEKAKNEALEARILALENA